MLTNEGDYFAVILKFVLPIGLLAIVIAGVWLMIAGSRGEDRRIVWSHFRIHLGTAFLISAITIVLVDIQLRREVETIVNGIPDGVVNYISRGDENLARTVRKQIEFNHISYSDVEIHADLKLDDEPEHKSPEYVIYTWTMDFTVRNTGPSEESWDFHPNVSSDLDCAKEKPMAQITHVSVKEGGRDPSLVTPEDWKKGYKEGNCEKGPDYVASFHQVLHLKPNVPYQVRITRSIHDRLKGYSIHSFFQIVTGIKYFVTLDPDKFDYSIEANYPGGRQSERPEPTSNIKGSKVLDPYVILETLLPNQGFTLYWRPKLIK